MYNLYKIYVFVDFAPNNLNIDLRCNQYPLDKTEFAFSVINEPREFRC